MESGGSLNAPLMSATDPFYAVRDHLDSEVHALRTHFDEWQSLLQSVNTASDTKFRVKHEEVKRDLGKCEEMARKVRMAVTNIERNRVKFPHVDDRELQQRRAAVDRLDAMVQAMKVAFNSRETQGKLESDQRKELTSRMAAERDSAARNQNVYTKANSDYMSDQKNMQATIRREQDQSLDKLGSGLDTLKEMAVAIDAELKDQEKMIDDIDKGVDEAQGKFDQANKAIEKLLKTKDKCQIATILILVIIFVITAIVAFS